MKTKEVTTILLALTALVVFYLLGAFAAATFDISQWDAPGRFSIAVCGLSSAGLVILFRHADILS